MKQHQDEDAFIQKLIEKTNTDQYTIKEVEGVFLVHNHNKILVLLSMRNRFYNDITFCSATPGRKEWRRQYVLSLLGKA